ncbi:MFS family permease [Nocardioides cavernae]|uniref:MFS family permease n=1 Tax=Nocardioides cavernae TaxID=1921566 RepID=A0A7Y9H070_9ACTN|nr:MFS transporter [Nocardioides cavernae]NYE35513.1 MFS family permease [Nocardioides cavernae]
MYISVRDRPGADERAADGTRAARPPVGRAVVLLGIVSLLTDVSSESVSAILPLYLTMVVGLSPVAYGLIDGLYQGVSALVRLGGGWVSDATDRPKWVAFLGYGLSAVARVFLLFASGAAGIAAVVTADRIGKGIRTAPRDAMISTATPTEHLGRAFGVHRMLDTIGAALGPLIAFGLLWAIPDGYSVVLVVSLAFALAGVALLGLLGPDVRPRRDRGARAAGQTGPTPPPFRWRDLGDRRLRPLLVVAGVLGLLTVGDGFIYLALLDHGGVNVTWFPLFYVGTNVAYLFLAVPIGRLADRVGRSRTLVLGHLALVGAYLCSVLPTSTAAATVGTLALLGVFYAATDGVIAAIAGRLVPVQARTSGIAAAQTVVAVARMLASAGFGLLWFLLGPAAAMATVATLLTVAIAGAATRIGRLDRSEVTA